MFKCCGQIFANSFRKIYSLEISNPGWPNVQLFIYLVQLLRFLSLDEFNLDDSEAFTRTNILRLRALTEFQKKRVAIQAHPQRCWVTGSGYGSLASGLVSRKYLRKPTWGIYSPNPPMQRERGIYMYWLGLFGRPICGALRVFVVQLVCLGSLQATPSPTWRTRKSGPGTAAWWAAPKPILSSARILNPWTQGPFRSPDRIPSWPESAFFAVSFLAWTLASLSTTRFAILVNTFTV